jgi:hypothetical protein
LRDPSNLAALREQGFQFFQTPTDLDFLAAGASEYLQKTGKKVPK